MGFSGVATFDHGRFRLRLTKAKSSRSLGTLHLSLKIHGHGLAIHGIMMDTKARRDVRCTPLGGTDGDLLVVMVKMKVMEMVTADGFDFWALMSAT